MSQSSFGKKFVVTTWGESHGKAIGAVLDGCPAGLSLCEEDIQVFLDRRKPGQSRYTTHTPIVPVTQTLPLTRNTDSVITVEVDAPPEEKPPDVWQPVPLPSSC